MNSAKATIAAMSCTIRRVEEEVVANTPAVKKAPSRVPDKLTGASMGGYLLQKKFLLGIARQGIKG